VEATRNGKLAVQVGNDPKDSKTAQELDDEKQDHDMIPIVKCCLDYCCVVLPGMKNDQPDREISSDESILFLRARIYK
jgi:hypothetical protein